MLRLPPAHHHHLTTKFPQFPPSTLLVPLSFLLFLPSYFWLGVQRTYSSGGAVGGGGFSFFVFPLSCFTTPRHSIFLYLSFASTHRPSVGQSSDRILPAQRLQRAFCAGCRSLSHFRYLDFLPRRQGPCCVGRVVRVLFQSQPFTISLVSSSPPLSRTCVISRPCPFASERLRILHVQAFVAPALHNK